MVERFLSQRQFHERYSSGADEYGYTDYLNTYFKFPPPASSCSSNLQTALRNILQIQLLIILGSFPPLTKR
jgi:hypothetical protein